MFFLLAQPGIAGTIGSILSHPFVLALTYVGIPVALAD